MVRGYWWDTVHGTVQWKQLATLSFGAPKTLQMVTAAMKLKDTCFLEKRAMTKIENILKSRDIILPTKVCLVKAMVFLHQVMDVRVGP